VNDTRRFGDVAVGDELPALSRTVTREDVKAYADASGDQNPLHQDDDFARSVGFPGIIAHGMLTMAHLESCVVRWLGDPSGLLRMRVGFRAAVLVGDVIVAGGRVRELDPVTRTAVLHLWVRLDRDGVTEHAIRRGEATVRLA